jgi:fructose-specific phosphotransferase system IIA component
MRLTDVLKKELIKIPLSGNNRDDVIQELIDKLAENDVIKDSKSIFQAVIEREKIMSTGVGKEIAIPHCKTDSSPGFAVCLGIHPKGIEFKAIDNQPVKIVFLLVGPEDNPGMHIKLLSRISRMMNHEDLRNQLTTCEDAETAFQIIEEEENYFFEID